MAAPAEGVLGRIAAHVGKGVERLKLERTVEALRKEPFYARKPGDFAAAFAGPFPRVIAEVKFASPSEGFLRKEEPNPDAARRIAASYLAGGAAALSILTERNFFAGATDFLSAVRRENPEAPLLMKDFFIDPYQFELARACGADCVLLIAALLGPRLAQMHRLALALGLSALVEVHDEAELAAAKACGAALIGVNSRDLKTLKTDLDTARRLAPKAGPGLLIAESGLKTKGDLRGLAELGYKGFLIGTAFMKAEDPGSALAEMIS